MIIGIILVVIGVMLRVISIRTLMRNFCLDINSKPRYVVQEGIYKYIRHPSYTGSIIILSGFACIDIKLFAIYFSWVFFKTRIIEEERHLTNWFGQKYVDYKQKTGELFPKIRRSENA